MASTGGQTETSIAASTREVSATGWETCDTGTETRTGEGGGTDGITGRENTGKCEFRKASIEKIF